MPFDHELKLARAEHHIHDLHARATEWRRQHRLTYRLEGDLNKGEALVVLASGAGPGPDPLALIAGDAIHNMRASLDLLAFALLRANYAAMSRPVPRRAEETSEFPIVNDPVGYAKKRSVAIGGIDPSAQAIIDGLQPHQSVGVSHPLWTLRTLDNINKHRVLNVVYAVVGHLGHKTFSNVDFSVMNVEWTNQPVTTDTPVARITGLKPRDMQAEARYEVEPDYYLALAEGHHIVEPRPVGPLLAAIHTYIGFNVFPLFVSYLT